MVQDAVSPCDLLVGSFSAFSEGRPPGTGVACQTLVSIQEAGVSDHRVLDSESLCEVGGSGGDELYCETKPGRWEKENQGMSGIST